jgi:hypothetical protein
VAEGSNAEELAVAGPDHSLRRTDEGAAVTLLDAALQRCDAKADWPLLLPGGESDVGGPRVLPSRGSGRAAPAAGRGRRAPVRCASSRPTPPRRHTDRVPCRWRRRSRPREAAWRRPPTPGRAAGGAGRV